MGFPAWTLWGMGLSAVGALLALLLALLGQSPQLLKRSGLIRARLDLRVRAFTSYAFALLLLAIGFFLAGVPIGSLQAETPEEENSLVEVPGTGSESGAGSGGTTIAEQLLPTPTLTPGTPESGAFGGPPTEAEDAQSENAGIGQPISPTLTVPVTTPSATAAGPTSTPTRENTATPTATPLPTETPTPTLTPTPISGQTAVVDAGGSRIWMRRSPGGQDLVLVSDQEILLILPGHANQGGQLWQEVSTLDGVNGWLLEELLSLSE
jgi:hypothetical protein